MINAQSMKLARVFTVPALRRLQGGLASFMLLGVSACGGAAATSPSVMPSSSPVSVPSDAPTDASANCPIPATTMSGDDWTTYAHDQQRTGCQSQATGITTSNVASLKLKWTYSAGDTIFASLIAVQGTVYGVTMNSGTVFALDAGTGALKWKRTLGGPGKEVRGTPVYADGTLFVGMHDFGSPVNGQFPPEPSAFYALDATSGSVQWTQSLPGTVRGVPIVLDRQVMIPVAGGDPPFCLQGGVYAFNETTGTPSWSFAVDPTPNDGGSVWSPMATDGTHLYFGTGNTCVGTPLTANGVVSTDLLGRVAWRFNTSNQLTDDDVGGGTLIANSEAITIAKNGNVYLQDLNSGAVLKTISLNVADGTGGYSTPVTDGKTIVFGTSAAAATGSALRRRELEWDGHRIDAAGPGGRLLAYDFGGNLLWSVTTTNHVYNASAISNGVLFSDVDDDLVARDLRSGRQLWAYDAQSQIFASPVAVPSGVYTADSHGNVYKFALQ